MTGLDSNIVVQLAVAAHPGNRATTEFFQAEIQRGEIFAFPSLVSQNSSALSPMAVVLTRL
jgi:hypothetical protein